ncbi:serine protease [Thalassotalea sp. 42_200_T64]|nr:serine protease [Thalassotalea sp. 42_200_T64]
MLRWITGLLFIVSFACKAATDPSPIDSSSPTTTNVPVLTIKGAIGPAVSAYLVKGISKANLENAPLLIITIDTPGGLSSSLRDINMAILASRLPIACLVYPQGARAASAGTYILYACHIAAMSTATTLGAATPVSIGGPSAPKEKQESKPASPTAMEKKVLNDAIAYIRSLAQLRGRNEEWAELAVREAATLTATEALEKNVINLMAQTPDNLLQQLNGYSLTINDQQQQLELSSAKLFPVEPDWRNKFIATITDPNIAYILMLIGIYGLLLEFYSPGGGIAGVTGGIALFVALYAFQLLPVNFAGAGLLILGIALMVAESMAPSFGVLGLGGIVAFVLGSIFLIDTEQNHFQISIPLIASVAFISTLLFVFTLGYLWRTRNNKVVSGQEEIIGGTALVESDFNDCGYVIFNGERWAAESTEPLLQGQTVQVLSIQGLTLQVAKFTTMPNDGRAAKE